MTTSVYYKFDIGHVVTRRVFFILLEYLKLEVNVEFFQYLYSITYSYFLAVDRTCGIQRVGVIFRV